MSKERLVELLARKSCWNNDCPDKGCGHCDYIAVTSEAVEQIAELLLADGWIRPPCKVGDKVFVICNNEVQETSVFSMSADISDVRSVYYILAYAVDGTRKDKDGYYTSCLMSFMFGFSAFSSREEAVAKLRESESK
jgi:hypothetical protein